MNNNSINSHNNNNNNNVSVYGAVAVAAAVEGVYHVLVVNVETPLQAASDSETKPIQTVNALVGCYRPSPPSLFIIIAHSKR